MHDVKYIFNDRDCACILTLCITWYCYINAFVSDKRMIECRTESLIIFLCRDSVCLFISLFYGLIILPMKRGAPASSLHSIRTKGCRAAKEEKEREKEMLVAAAASTPFSVSERKALWRASEMNDSDSSGNIPHKLGFKKSSDKP